MFAPDEGKKEEKNATAEKKTIDTIVTLKNIDLSIKKGEFVCVIGDVGSGKSSLLSTLIGDLLLVKPSLIEKYGGE